VAVINWTRESEIWLKDIYNYIAADDPDAAAKPSLVFTKRPSYCKLIQELGIDTNQQNPLKFAFSCASITV
jgi:hypothetical protein